MAKRFQGAHLRILPSDFVRIRGSAGQARRSLIRSPRFRAGIVNLTELFPRKQRGNITEGPKDRRNRGALLYRARARTYTRLSYFARVSVKVI